jgi:hypothetical protein
MDTRHFVEEVKENELLFNIAVENVHAFAFKEF